MRIRHLSVIGFATLAASIGAATSFARERHQHGQVDAPKTTKPEKPFPLDVTWVLQTIDGKPVGTGDPPSFKLDGTLRARGFAGCNTFSMTYYPVRNQTLAAGAVALTRTLCPPAAMALERTFLGTMHALPKWDLRADGDLTIATARTALRFRRGI